MESIYIGIDLATLKTGFAFVNHNDKKIATWVVENKKFTFSNVKDIYQNFKENFIDKISQEIDGDFKRYFFKIGIEVSNFNSQELAIKFNFLAGMLVNFCIQFFPNCQIKIFNANEWFYYLAQILFITQWTSLEREERKKTSINFATTVINRFLGEKRILTDDEADAFCIAYFFDKCKDTFEKNEFVRNNTKQFKQKAKSKRARLFEYDKKINKCLNEINNIQIKAQTSKILEKTKIRLKNLEDEILKLKKEKRDLQNEKNTIQNKE